MTLEITDSEPATQTPPLPTPSLQPDFEWSDKLALERIEAITRNARATWFGLLGLLAFVMVTLLGVEDIDFFGYDRETTLPLFGVAVPTITFFVAAPILAAAVYAYFHFYLMKLWDALGRAPARVFSNPIGDLIHPWLLSDAALVLRDNLQIRDDDKAIRQKRMANEGAAAIRPLRWVSALTSAALTWVAGWVTLGYAWAISWPAHEEWLSLLIFGCFLFTLWTGAASLWAIWVRVGRRDFAPEAANFWRGRRKKAAVSLIATLGCVLTWNKTEGGLEGYLESAAIRVSDWRFNDEAQGPFGESYDDQVARRDAAVNAIPSFLKTSALGSDDLNSIHLDERVRNRSDFVDAANLFEAQLVEKPADWADRMVAELDFRRQWCDRRNFDWALCVKNPGNRQIRARRAWCQIGKAVGALRDGIACDEWFEHEEGIFQTEWSRRREEYIAILRKPNLEGRDLRGANLTRGFLPGVNLENARLEGANLREARLEQADLSEARLEGANLIDARLERADLRRARLEGANLNRARLQGADISAARLEGASLREARLENANLSVALLKGANLGEAHLESADLSVARLEGAILHKAWLQRADLSAARLQGANLHKARLDGANLAGAQLQRANLYKARLDGANLSGAKLEGANLSWAQLHSTDFSGATGLTQVMLSFAIGDADTILPEIDGPPLYVWSCLVEPTTKSDPISAIQFHLQKDSFTAQLYCGIEGPKKTGRTAIP